MQQGGLRPSTVVSGKSVLWVTIRVVKNSIHDPDREDKMSDRGLEQSVSKQSDADFEIDIEAESAYDVRHIQQALDSATGGAISEMRILSELEDYKFSFYPMRVW